MTQTTTTTSTSLLTLRGALREMREAGFTDERFIITPSSRTEHVEARFIPNLGITIAAFDAAVGGYEVYDREASTVEFVRFDTEQARHIAELERLTKVRGAEKRRWRLRGK